MAITVIVRPAGGPETRLTFDGTQRIVFGRGASCDVRLPDASVSMRHASLRAQGADFVLFDEGSTNGTWVGDVRIAGGTSRIVRSGERARLGRLWVELRIEQVAVSRDVAGATRDLALALVASALSAAGEDLAPRVVVVEGPDQGAELRLSEEDRVYVFGRGRECDLPLADPDASREHAGVVRHGGAAFLLDRGAKNGTWLGESRAPRDREVAWRPAQMVRIGATVLALREPVADALAHIEAAPDEPVAAAELAPPASPPEAAAEKEAAPPASAAPVVPVPVARSAARARKKKWSVLDVAVMTAALGVLALSIAGLVWLLRG
jgi:pSer/pThr/pTyr-binding forkhead associated (FHA) protein